MSSEVRFRVIGGREERDAGFILSWTAVAFRARRNLLESYGEEQPEENEMEKV